jgi:TetR/AcrR family acrAB operon transcriptional repressor
MARKTKEEAEATREGILDAAEACFLEHGVFRTTLEHIAARAGYTRGAVYWHFKNKLEVLQAVIDRVRVPLFVGLEEMSREMDRPLCALRRFHKNALDDIATVQHARNTIEITMLRCEYADDTREIYTYGLRSSEEAVVHLTTTLQRAKELGQLREGVDPAAAALAIHFLIGGALRHWLLDPTKSCLQRDGMAALDLFLAGIAAEGALDAHAAEQIAVV